MYGRTIRKIRKDKGLTLKEVYLGIVSKSFYIEFEKGNYNIEMSKFKKILDELALNFEEFIYIHQNYKTPNNKNLKDQISLAYSKWDLISLNGIYQEYKDSQFIRERFLASKAYALIYITEDNAKHMSEVPLKELQIYLSSLKEWTLEDIQDYIAISGAFDAATDKVLFQRALTSLQKYQYYETDTYNTLCINLFMGHIQKLLLNQQITEAEKSVRLMKEVIFENITLGLNIFIKCCDLLVSFYSADNQNEEETKIFLNALDIINFEQSAQIKSLISLHKSLSEGRELDTFYTPTIHYSEHMKKIKSRKE